MKRIMVESLDALLLLEQMEEPLVDEEASLDAFAMRYAADEEIGCGEKELERDRHRWELDPASAEDYLERIRPAALAWRWRHFNA